MQVTEGNFLVINLKVNTDIRSARQFVSSLFSDRQKHEVQYRNYSSNDKFSPACHFWSPDGVRRRLRLLLSLLRPRCCYGRAAVTAATATAIYS